MRWFFLLFLSNGNLNHRNTTSGTTQRRGYDYSGGAVTNSSSNDASYH
jgi:hypothetical protein